MLRDRDRVRLGFEVAIALAVFSFMGSHCQRAPKSEPHPIASARPTSHASPQPSASSGAAIAIASAAAFDTLPGSTPAQLSPAVMEEGPVAIRGYRAARDKLQEAAKAGRSMKPAFIRCRERALARKPPTLNGNVRLLVRVGASGRVREIELPQWQPRNPSFDWFSQGSPMPNPDNGNLARLVVPCLKARVFQSRFSTSKADWTFTIDIASAARPNPERTITARPVRVISLRLTNS